MKRFQFRKIQYRLWLVTTTEAFASGLALSLTGGTLQAWLATEKVDITVIGWFGLAGLPYVWRFLWAPLFDGIQISQKIGRRAYLYVTRVILTIGYVWLSMLSPSEHLVMMAALVLILNIIGASQDSIIDAYRNEILDEKLKGAGASVYNFSARIALLIAGAGSLALADLISWKNVYLVFALFNLLTLVFLPFGPMEPINPIQKKSIHQVLYYPFQDFLKQSHALWLLLFCVFYKLGDAFSVALLTPFLMEVGYLKMQIAAIFKGVGMGATMAGTLLGGYITYKKGLIFSLTVFGLLQTITNLGFWWVAQQPPDSFVLTFAVILDQFFGGLGTTAFVAFIMTVVRVPYTATQMALLGALTSIGRVTMGVPAGYLSKYLGWPGFYLFSLVVALPGLLLIYKIKPVIRNSK